MSTFLCTLFRSLLERDPEERNGGREEPSKRFEFMEETARNSRFTSDKTDTEVEARALRGFSSLFCDSLVRWRLQPEHWIVLPPLGKRRWNHKVARDIHGSSTLLH